MPPRIASPDPDRVRARLVPLDGSAPADLDRDQTAIGTAADNHVILAATTVSRHHAILARNGREYRVIDLNSTNGTLVNGRRIDRSAIVRSGDEIRFGSARFVLRDHPDTLAIPPPARRFSPLAISALVVILFAASFGFAHFLLSFNRLEQSASDASPASLASPAAPATQPAAASSAGAAPPAPAAPPPPEVLAWLEPLNRYRAMAGLAAVTADPTLSRGDFLHARYLVENYADNIRKGVNLGARMHTEDRTNRWYTEDGSAAAQASDVDEIWDPREKPKSSWALDNWIQVPFHRMPILNPRLHRVGYGAYCEGDVCVAALNVNGGTDPMPAMGQPFAVPVQYPPNGSAMRAWTLDAEWPDPLTSCPGYGPQPGLPITLELGPRITPSVSAFSLTLNRTPVEACEFDANTYRNPDPHIQNLGRSLLSDFGGVVLIPRAPLIPGTYFVSITTADRTYGWSFTITP